MGEGDIVSALKPVNGTPTGRIGNPGGEGISKVEGRIAAAWCLEHMKNFPQCSQRFVGVAYSNGHCWCVQEGSICNTDHFAGDRLYELVPETVEVTTTTTSGVQVTTTTASSSCNAGELKKWSFTHAPTYS